MKSLIAIAIAALSLSAHSDYVLEANLDQTDNMYTVSIIGHNPDVGTTPEDLWEAGGLYAFYPTTPQALEVVSSSLNDDVGGTGAQRVYVEGLDGSYNVISEFVNLDGTTAVDLVNTYLRVNLMECREVGSVGSNDGAITLRIDGAGTTASYISANEGRADVSVYTVPANVTCIFLGGNVTTGKGDDCSATFYQRRPGQSWHNHGEIYTFEAVVPLVAGLYKPIEPRSDLRIEVVSTVASTTVTGSYGLLIIEN